MISIIVPIYNVIPYLPQCLESLVRQTFSDIEIILVDDGSTDGSAEICNRYARQDSRITVIHKENGGLVSARKTGLKAANGEYIAYVDGDDWIELNMYERMYARITEWNADVVMCGRYEDTGSVSRKVFHGIPEGRYDKRALLKDVYPRMIVNDAFFEWGIFPGVWDKLFRRERLERFQMAVDERIMMGEDAACTYPCLLNAESIYVMQECLYHYRQRASSMVKEVPDSGLEREQFRILYETVNRSLGRYADIFDLREQWKIYLLFMMVPRSPSLYRGFEKLDFLFPFPEVKRGDNIVIYGAGAHGQRLYHYIEETGFCHIKAWADRNYIELQAMGLPVDSPERVSAVSFDAIVIANTYERSRKALYQELIKKYPPERVYMLDEELVFSRESLTAFGLIEASA